MPAYLQRRILRHIADQRYAPRTVAQLAADLGMDDEQRAAFEEAVKQLESEGQVLLGSGSQVTLPPPGDTVIGTFRGSDRGFGFLIPDEPLAYGDVFIPPNATGRAMSGDRVKVRVRRDTKRAAAPGRSPYVGRVAEVLTESDQPVVGVLIRYKGGFAVKPDGRVLPDPIRVLDPGAKDAKVGDKIAVELLRVDGSPTEAVIVEVLGEAGEPDVETLSTMRNYGLADAFPEAVVREARAASQKMADADVSARTDLRDVFIATIDPPDARDFDDAISIEKLDPAKESDRACWQLGVHIADVATFVPVGGPLDEEAYARGNSTYLPRRVIPMLPEVLSNGVCSLQEGVDRFAKSVFIRFDGGGNVIDAEFHRSIIHSNKRLTYLEAQALIDGNLREAIKHARTEPHYPRELMQRLKWMDDLAKTIRQRRLRDGMIVLGLPEVELVFDDTGRVIDAVPEDDAFTHTIIEMFMVEANEAAARLFHAMKLPMVRRVHPDPDVLSTDELRGFARVAGYNIPSHPTRHELQQLLDAVRGKPAQYSVHLAVLKTLSKAEYAPSPVGHFALASKHYTHFTSPIRRYPDLIIHRALDAFIEARAEMTPAGGKPNLKRIHKAIAKDKRCPDEEKIAEMGQHCSRTERNSESAERDLRRFLVMQLLAEHLGEDFEGTVTGVTNAGVFVQIDKYVTDGFVAAADLPPTGDRWRLNPNTGALVAQHSGRAVTIGHRFVVRIASVDLPARRMELVVVDGIDSDGRRQPVDGRGKSTGKQGGKQHGGKGGGKSGGKSGGKPRRQSEGSNKSHPPKGKKKGKAKGKPKGGKGKPAGDPGEGSGRSKKKRRKR
ncbi:MAG: VacB/RNase II family 3'-5' exoribonuclease [Planctomycetota bacterium]